MVDQNVRPFRIVYEKNEWIREHDNSNFKQLLVIPENDNENQSHPANQNSDSKFSLSNICGYT